MTGTTHLMACNGIWRIYTAELFMPNKKRYMSKASGKVNEGNAYTLCCFTTTLAKTCRHEVNTAAQVSSALDSNARTVNARCCRRDATSFKRHRELRDETIVMSRWYTLFSSPQMFGRLFARSVAATSMSYAVECPLYHL